MHSTTYLSHNGMNTYIKDLPECLRQYLTIIDDPHDSYEYISSLRDQRTRLLLRRFTNQIQYGCKNVQCTVPTCLSYRKRHALRPVRPYIGIAAQALAVQCVERCISNGCLDEAFKRGKGRSISVRSNSRNASLRTGLCYSEPVVPWYSHPDDQSRRAGVAARSRRLSQNGSQPKPSSERAYYDTNGSARSHSDSYLHGSTQDLDSSSLKTDDYPIQAAISGALNGASPTSPQKTAENGRDNIREQSNGRSEEDVVPLEHVKSRKKDHASFTQWLFDNKQFRVNENPWSHDTSMTGVHHLELELHTASSLDRKQEAEVASSLIDEFPDHVNDSDGFSVTHGRTQGLWSNFSHRSSLKLLPASSILWLRYFATKPNEARNVSRAAQELKDNSLHSQKSATARFIRQSLYFTLSDPQRLIMSSSSWEEYPRYDPDEITEEYVKDRSQNEFQNFHQRRKCAIPKKDDFASLCPDLLQLLKMSADLECPTALDVAPILIGFLLAALHNCYQSPLSVEMKQGYSIKYYSNAQVAHLILLVFNFTYGVIRTLNDQDVLYNALVSIDPEADWGPSNLKHVRDDDLASDLIFSPIFTAIASLISHRIRIDALRRLPILSLQEEDKREVDILPCVISILSNPLNFDKHSGVDFDCIVRLFKTMRAVISREWDRSPYVKRVGPTAGALEILAAMHEYRDRLRLPGGLFEMESIGEILDEIDLPFKWNSFQPDMNRIHILEYPFLFTRTQILRYFRSINLKIMKHAHEKAMTFHAHAKSELVRCKWRVNGLGEVLEKARAHMTRYFVLTISRESLLEDAIGQIWRRERQELLRPLKVRIGKEEGEEGIDHGGVQQEFFRLVFAEAFDPNYGMFDVDSTTYMAWFKPGSVEPLYKFESLGILMALAIFNGVTVPITMPAAFYKKILGMEVVDEDDIEDGWPDLARSFKTMLEFEDGDVGDVIGRTYEFAYDAFGTVISINMTKAKQSQPDTEPHNPNLKGKERATLSNDVGASTHAGESDEKVIGNQIRACVEDTFNDSQAPLVTNANRKRYVIDYVDHLVNVTVKHQFEAFLRGLHTVISPRSLTLFSNRPRFLKLVVEGQPLSQPLDLNEWSSTATYDDYEPSDSPIVWFWEILREDLDQTQLRKLLEFVTACNRIPVNGWEGVTFLIQRNGEGDERLPTSSTCYGRLLLPNYSSKSVLKAKLEKAIENSLGFGAL